MLLERRPWLRFRFGVEGPPYLPNDTDSSLPLDVLAVSSLRVNLIFLSLAEEERLWLRAVTLGTTVVGKTSMALPFSSLGSITDCPSSAERTASCGTSCSWAAWSWSSWLWSEGPWECPCPPRTKNPTMFEARPSEPTMRISFGLKTSGGSRNLVIASRMIDRHKAIRKTALKKAPRISALSHYVWSVKFNCGRNRYATYTEGVLVVARLLCSLDCPETNC